mgnify:CR=1 FL=1
MIGGEDIRVAVAPEESEDVRGFVLLLLRAGWPAAVVDDLDDPRGPRCIDEVFPVHAFREVLVYRDDASRRAWDEHGATAETNDSMIHILSEAGGLTFVVDARNSMAGVLVEEIIGALPFIPRPQGSLAPPRNSKPPETSHAPTN